MIAGEDLAMLNLRRIDVPKTETTTIIAPLHFQHLIEVAIEHFAAPIPS